MEKGLGKSVDTCDEEEAEGKGEELLLNFTEL
jgi:hypothetical protein